MHQRNAFPSFAALRTFIAYGEMGGVRKAAQALDIDHAVVSRNLRALEAQLSTALIDRSSPEQWLTEDGLAYYDRVAPALKQIADVTEAFRKRHDKRFLLWSAPGFAHRWLLPRLPDFNDRYPGIDLALRPSDNSVNFARDEADGEIRYIKSWQAYEPLAEVRVAELDRPAIFPVASPAYLSAIAQPIARIADLPKLRLLHEEDDEEWRRWLAAHDVHVQSNLAGPRLWHANLMVDAALAGQGIALANNRLVGDLLESGRLQAVTFAEDEIRRVELGGYCMIARTDRWTAMSLARFREWLKEKLEERG